MLAVLAVHAEYMIPTHTYTMMSLATSVCLQCSAVQCLMSFVLFVCFVKLLLAESGRLDFD